MPHRWQDVVQVQGTPELKGRGKYGKVFLVHVTCGDDPKVKQVAVKEVKYDSENETQALSVQMEASCLKILSSNPDPHFPRYLRQFTDPEDGKAWIMTQWASGGTFRDLINGGKENRNSASHLKTRLWLFYDMMRGLEQLHDNGMVHRDLKPANLLVSEPCEGPCRALIGDLGLICHVADKKKEVVGTPSYIAPEVFDNQAATQANDVWAAGIILYELLFLEAHVRGSILVHMCWKLPAADLLPRRYSDLAKDLGSGILDSEIQEVLEGMLKGAREECSSKSKPDPSIRWAASQVLQSDFMQKVADFRTITSSKEDLSKCEE